VTTFYVEHSEVSFSPPVPCARVYTTKQRVKLRASAVDEVSGSIRDRMGITA